MASPGLEQETFKNFLDTEFSTIDPSDPLHKLRLKAIQRAKELGLPTRKTEVYRYIKLRHLYAQNFGKADQPTISAEQMNDFVLPECANSFLVFINGNFNSELSNTSALPSKVVISTLQGAARTYSTLLNNQWTQSLKEESDPFAAINAAIHGEGAFIYIPPKTVVEAPIQILHLMDSTGQTLLFMPRINVYVGTQAQATFAATNHYQSQNEYLVNQVAEFVIEEDAHINYIQNLTEVPTDVWHVDAVRVILKRNSTFKSTAVTEGSATVRTDYRVILAGENSEVFLNGVWMLEDKNESHVNVYIEHQAPRCRSNQLFKGVLNDFSRSSFEGKIMVRQAAQKTEAFQLNNNIILNDHAHADSKPNLEIFADDVKASHGATVGQLDTEQLFYMKTRGFPEKAAKNLLIFGFCEEVIERISLESLKFGLSEKARRYLKDAQSF